jgi:hypothetical protein
MRIKFFEHRRHTDLVWRDDLQQIKEALRPERERRAPVSAVLLAARGQTAGPKAAARATTAPEEVIA